MVEVWPRERHTPSASDAYVLLWVFLPVPLREPPRVSRARHGVPEGDVISSLRLSANLRSDDPEWFSDFFRDGLGSIAERELGEEFETVRKAEEIATVEINAHDPVDLGYLQAAWAMAQCLCDMGGRAVLDAHAARWRKASDVVAWPPDRAFDVRREVTVVFETDETPGIGHIAHTRGLRKFGRPDLVLSGLSSDDATWANQLLNAAADELAQGRVLDPGDWIAVDDRALYAAVYDPGGGMPDLNLNNAALVLVQR